MILSEIIFFAAIALLFLLLMRRNKYLMSFISSMSNMLRGTRSLRMPRMNIPRPTLSKRQPSTDHSAAEHPPIDNQHQFWQEETALEKPELVSYYEEGDQLFKSGQYEEAERFFLKAATVRPNDAKVYARLGLIYLNLKNYNDAIESFKVATKIDKYNPSRHYNLALAYMGNNDTQRAISSVREAISLDPVTPKYRQLLEQLLQGK